jgi:CDP-diacylglycerol--serine O-phosphatidyltransferase
MKPIRPIAVLPTLFTLGNLVCGFFAIVVLSRIEKPEPGVDPLAKAPPIEFKMESAKELTQSAKELFGSDVPTHNLMLCGALILLAMLFDAVDGQVARITRGVTDFGGQLDSLCDLVSFGLAPAILLVKMCPQFTNLHSEAIWGIAALFACCAALRLARFNVESDADDDHTTFAGLPTPAAAAAIASFAILSYTLRTDRAFVTIENFDKYDWWMQRLLPLFSVMIALLMVSRVPYPHPLTQFVRGHRSFAQVVAIVFSLMALLTVRSFAVPLLCVLFVIVPPIKFAWEVVWHRRVREESLF